MFNLEGCRLGCCGRDVLDSNNIKYPSDVLMHEGCSCGLEVVDEEGLEFEVSTKSVKKPKSPKATKVKKEKSSSSAPKKKSSSSFTSLLSNELEDL